MQILHLHTSEAAMPIPLSLAEHTLYAELLEQSLDAMFDDQFPENGSFVTRSVARRDGARRSYFYYQGYHPNNGKPEVKSRFSRYVGRADDPEIVRRVQGFQQIKAHRKARAHLVDALAGAGLPRPPVMIGRVIEALAKAGVFRLRAVLVGTVAYQTYSGLLGMRLSRAAAMTGDVDLAQFRSISIGVEDTTPPLLEVLRAVDPTFRAIPNRDPRLASTAFANSSNFRLDILTAHRGGNEEMGAPMKLDALAGVSGEPLRFMDYLLRAPVRSLVLYGPGVSVNVPAPERFAIHKLIVSTRRPADAVGTAKSRKDLAQSGELILAFNQSGRASTIESAWREAWERGPHWRVGLQRGSAALIPEARAVLARLWDGAVDSGPS
jgi:hypothetical protein